MKALGLLLLLVLGCLLCSCSRTVSSESFQKSKHLEVTAAEFLLLPSVGTVVLSVEVDTSERPEKAKYLHVSFPVGTSEDFVEKIVVPLSRDGKQKVRSSALKELEFMESYQVILKLSVDREGTEFLDELTQSVRFEVPPAALEKMGVHL